jgi:Ice-binding-like
MATPIDTLLGSAVNFEILAYSAVTGGTGAGAAVSGGNVGIYPTAVTAVTNFPPSTVASPFSIHGPDSQSQQAQTDATTAYNAFQALPGGTTIVGNLNGQTFTPGIYKVASSLDLSVGGTVTLNGGGDPNAQFIFQIGSTLTINNGATVVLVGNVSPRNVIWLVGSSATIGTTAVMLGDVIAQASITANAGSTVTGRLLALTGAVTLSASSTFTSPAQVVVPPLPPFGSSIPATVTLSELCHPDITGKTLRSWGLVTVSPGGYIVGGIPFGLMNFWDVRTVDFNGFLRCEVYGEEIVTNIIGTSYTYHYSPVNDALQIFNNGVELGATQTIPLAILADVLLFEATCDRTTVRG